MSQSTTFKGSSLSPGKCHAQVCMYSAHFHHAVTEYALNTDEDVKREVTRFRASLKAVAEDLEKAARDVSARIGKAEAEIFTAQKHILTDPAIAGQVETDIQSKKWNAEHAVAEVYRGYEESFEQMADDYLKERAKDIADIRRRLLDHLKEVAPGFICEGQSHCRRGMGRVIVTEELTPTMIVNTNFTRVKGFVTEHGGKASHAAIIARSLGIPAVSGIHGIMEIVKCGDWILVDGDTGTVVLSPEESLVKNLALIPHAHQAMRRKTPLGMEVLANASLPEDIESIREVDADGIGLFRTEFIFLKADRLLTEDEQYGIYSDIINKMDGKPVTFRLLDIGGDKPLPFIKMEAEANPYLGWRGSRFLLDNPVLLKSQLSALAKASRHGRIRVMFPMVIDVVQWNSLKAVAEETFAQAGTKAGSVPLGAMFEVPSACLQAGEIFKTADFGSIGSNDLIQYLFAVDRNNEHVAADFNPGTPCIMGSSEIRERCGQGGGKPLSICGEMASLPGVAARLVKAGIFSLSVSPRFIPDVRSELSGISSE